MSKTFSLLKVKKVCLSYGYIEEDHNDEHGLLLFKTAKKYIIHIWLCALGSSCRYRNIQENILTIFSLLNPIDHAEMYMTEIYMTVGV